MACSSPAGSVDELSASLGRLLGDADLRATLGRLGAWDHRGATVSPRGSGRSGIIYDDCWVPEQQPDPDRRSDRNRAPRRLMNPVTTAPRLANPHPHRARPPRNISRAGSLPLAPRGRAAQPSPRLAHRPGRGTRAHPLLPRGEDAGQTCGLLPLCFIRGPLFGRFLVSLPYLNYGGVLADDEASARLLIDRGRRSGQPGLTSGTSSFATPSTSRSSRHSATGWTRRCTCGFRCPEPSGTLWDGFPAKVRNQVRKGQKEALTVAWGRRGLLPSSTPSSAGTCATWDPVLRQRPLPRGPAAFPRPRRALRGPGRRPSRGRRTAVARLGDHRGPQRQLACGVSTTPTRTC